MSAESSEICDIKYVFKTTLLKDNGHTKSYAYLTYNLVLELSIYRALYLFLLFVCV